MNAIYPAPSQIMPKTNNPDPGPNVLCPVNVQCECPGTCDCKNCLETCNYPDSDDNTGMALGGLGFVESQDKPESDIDEEMIGTPMKEKADEEK